MSKITLVVGLLLVVQGVGFYLGTSSNSITALIPTFVGLPMLVLGMLAMNQTAHKHAMHLAAVLAMLGFIAASGRMVSAGLSLSPAGVSVLSMALVTGFFLLLCVKSFIDARRRGQSDG